MLVKIEELLVGRSLWLDWTNLEHLSSAETWLNKKPGVNEVQINYLPSIITLFCLHKLRSIISRDSKVNQSLLGVALPAALT